MPETRGGFTTFVLVRHGENDLIHTRLAGRQPGVHLNQRGRAQADQIARALRKFPIDAIVAGPLERACETAEPLCAATGLELHVADEFTEVDAPEWTNRTFEELRNDPSFRIWNTLRSFSAPPGGEPMLEVQARVLRKIRELRERYGFVVIFSHGDVIRATMAYALGVPLDLFGRIQIDSASISVFELGDDFVRVRLVNGSSDSNDLLPGLARPF